MAKGICSIEGCGKPAATRGWCTKHYTRWRRHGDPLVTAYGAPLAWIVALLAAPATDDCQTDWPFGRNSNGYPMMTWQGTKRLSHHVVLELTGRPRPAARDARHLCGRGHLGCLNPHHLEWGTTTQNMADRVTHGTSNRGERCGTAKLTRDDVRAIRASTETQSVVAARFGITQTAVSTIKLRKTWKWLD
jgi:hypothetical protein